MSVVASKNLYELLGNTHDEDSDREPEPPVKVIDKTPARTTKRNAPAEAPSSKVPESTGGRGGSRAVQGNEGAFRDRNAGSAQNRAKPIDEVERQRNRGSGEGRGRGGRSEPRNFDRHSRGVGGDSEKQASHGWGANEGKAELADEQAGEALANAETKDAMASWGEAEAASGAVNDAEREENNISYADYLIQQQEKKLALAAETPQLRKPNEGREQDKKWANAKPICRDEEEDLVPGAGGKAKRERERRQKQFLEIDQRFTEGSERGRGGGGPRGGRGRGGRGGRGDGPSRAGRGNGGQGNPETNASINTNDTSAFPSLGS
ncbi:telomere and ribosome associated protein/elicitor protein [Blumeria hordei DH14]|uniref:Telomere and ribosome associated protein/elicitor protein n=1 Tax=Blumeria graminis f. sp. hordei (strain DH14) TaxID=546991 RepID=N1JKG9_BLUG1|nr:telomere and ribosome associated protein/elicitor protein [Blumeria hordei DH14]